MEFFHVSLKPLKIDELFSVNDFEGEITYDHSKRPKEQQEINLLLDKHRPEHCPSRIKCIYMFDNLETCADYVKERNCHIYKVQAEKHWGPFPMRLVQELYKAQENKVQQIITEYWQPQNQWKVNEYITDEILVIEECTIDRLKAIAGQMQYNCDDALARKIFST